jgi:signal transduction histidine kinase/CheY-like chemotaxis protein
MLTAPLPLDELARLDCLHALDVLDTPADAVLDGLAGCARTVSGCPIALVSLVDTDRQWFKARQGLDAVETPRAPAFCAHAILGEGLFEVADARLDARFADNPLVLGAPHVVFYAGTPLVVAGHKVGTLCVIDQVPRTLTPAQREALRGLALGVQHWLTSRREQKLVAAREATLRKLAAQLPGFVYQFRLDPEGGVSFPFASEQVRELFEVEPAGVTTDGTPVFDRIHPDDLPAVMASVLVSARDLSPWRHEYRVQLPEQGLRWHEGRSRPERLADGSVLWHGFVSDITERREHDAAYREVQQRWQTAVGAARLGLIEIDLAQGHVTLDERAAAEHGLAAAGGLTLAEWSACFEPAERALLALRIDEAARAGAALTLRLALTGGSRHLELSAQPAGTGQAGLVGACRDVSEQVQLEQLRRDKAAAEQASREKSMFLSRVSHELRTPLNAILGFTQLLQLDAQHPLQPAQRSRLDRVRHAGSHLLALINDVLDLSQLQQGGRPLKPVDVALGAAIGSACALVEPLAQRRGLRIEQPAAAAALAVRADARALEQALVNLLSNGIKYNRDGGGLRITVRERDAQVEIAIADEGVGLSVGQLSQLFQPFNRLGAENRGIEGSGLGLVISRQVTEAMGGELLAASTPGRGSTFTLRLPRAELPAAVAAPPATQPGLLLPSAARPATILYIEDEPVNALLVTEALRAMPHWRVVIAEDGERGLAQARALRPDLLLIDINIPRLTGDEVVRRLRLEPGTRALPCIALSADALPEQIAAARAAGFDDYWTKPLDLPTLLARLQQRLALAAAPAAALAA